MRNDTDGNLAALRAYEKRIDEAEILQEKFEAAINDDIFEELEELSDRFKSITEKYGIEQTFLDYIREVL